MQAGEFAKQGVHLARDTERATVFPAPPPPPHPAGHPQAAPVRGVVPVGLFRAQVRRDEQLRGPAGGVLRGGGGAAPPVQRGRRCGWVGCRQVYVVLGRCRAGVLGGAWAVWRWRRRRRLLLCAHVWSLPAPPLPPCGLLTPLSQLQQRLLTSPLFLIPTLALLADDDESFLRHSGEKLPGHALTLSMGKVWEVVRQHKDLNLPAHRVSASRVAAAAACGVGVGVGDLGSFGD